MKFSVSLLARLEFELFALDLLFLVICRPVLVRSFNGRFIKEKDLFTFRKLYRKHNLRFLQRPPSIVV